VDGPEVLHDITLEIKSGERIGVVGRTGSGKSSLTLSLLRLIPTKGAVMYDGIITEGINLNALRNNMTISMSFIFIFHFNLAVKRITQIAPCAQYHSTLSFSAARYERTWTHSENMTTRRSMML
jgi:ABC-type dipeptide/oligopeptide/nickel transport system ATPase component